MSAFETQPQNGTDSTETITDLRALDVGDQVLFAGRQRQLDVVAVGTRTVVDERINAEIETPVVRVQGDWDGAVDRVLAHKLDRYDGGIQLEELDDIVACEGADLERGEDVTVRRVACGAEVSA
ncbi:hypothetical protein ACFQMF_01685 [Halorubrum rutilum]|uniref:Uncharacterized protein n=1 Tax=Halorubrum rutilum TaxID=1364933 RepID=A0ABD6AI73_9EURY|nr:hypothetical protein [Halorubrum rutilum]